MTVFLAGEGDRACRLRPRLDSGSIASVLAVRHAASHAVPSDQRESAGGFSGSRSQTENVNTGSLTKEHSAQRMTIRPGPAMNPLTALGIFALAIVIAGVVGAGLLAKRAHEMDSGDHAADPDHNVTEQSLLGRRR